MKKLILVIVFCIILCGCNAKASMENEEVLGDMKFTVSKISTEDSKEEIIFEAEAHDSMRGIWVSQFDMHPIYRDGGKQRSKEDYTAKVEKMISNLKRDGFNTVFLQLRPNGDSMFESDVYPTSKYIAGEYGGKIDYDGVDIFLKTAEKNGISVHAWINPFRLCTEDELISYGKGILYDWHKEGLGKRIEKAPNGILYLDPSYPEATELIVGGVREILEKYDFDGIHLDDYFYPTEFEFEDEREFILSGFADKGDFRRSNIDRTVKAIYNTTHEFGKIFGVSPAGNIYSLADGWFVDIYKWCSEKGYVDYIMPQLYYGFENQACPFERILTDWSEAVTNDSVRLYIGLSAAKCDLGSQGIEDKYAGDKGKFEWRDNKDILARSLMNIENCNNADGVCIFTYSSFYDPITGDDNPNTQTEKEAFCEIIR